MSKEQKSNKSGSMGGHGPGSGGMMTRVAEKPKNFKATIKRLVNYLKPYYVQLVIIFMLAIASTVFTILGPKILAGATDKLTEGVIGIKVYQQIQDNLPPGVVLPEGTKGSVVIDKLDPSIKDKIPKTYLNYINDLDVSQEPTIDFSGIGQILLSVLALYVLSAIFYYIQGYIMVGLTQKTIFKLREDVSQKIDRLPMKYFDENTHGEILSRVTNDIDTISNTLQQSLTQIIMSFVTIIGIVIMMLSISPWLTLITFLTLPISVLIAGMIAKKSQKEFKANQLELGNMNSHVEEMYAGQSIIQAYNQEDVSISKFDKINKRLYTASWKSQFVSSIIMPLLMFVGNLGYVAIAVIGGLLTNNGMLTVGSIQAFMQYSRQFTQPITDIANMFNILQSTAAGAERVFMLLDEEEEIPESSNPIPLKNIKGQIDFKGVDFSYIPEKELIKNLNLDIRAGHTIAIVGPTGAGKTTLVNLLMRFYELQNGAIYIDDHDIVDLSRGDLRNQFGMVLQDTWLFNGTIKENIAYGNDKATDQEIVAAAEAAYVDNFVRTLENGYDTVINEEGSNISSGQKQLITIARAILKNPPIMILDEATSNVDTRTEVLIQKAMNNIMQGRTSFVIAHRLSTIKNADHILVMNHGIIVETGNHKELLAQGGFYSDLYRSQFTNSELA
ncbi:MAG: ABC transporter ATP-binding protein/permease [Fusobacteria bacterium]|nr:ABC transporter ATP-binding protein/permease [Fusobacteriota bacterium]